MLTETKIKMNEVWKTNPSAEDYDTFIPSTLFLLMALDNGWNITRIQPVDDQDAKTPAYQITLLDDTNKKTQDLIIPKSALVEKIFELRTPVMAHPC